MLDSTTSPRSVVIRWKPPLYINAPLIGYRINLSRVDADVSSPGRRWSQVKEVTSVRDRRVMRETISRLTPATEYLLRVAVINEYGVGSFAQVRVSTQESSVGKTAGAWRLLSLSSVAFSVGLMWLNVELYLLQVAYHITVYV